MWPPHEEMRIRLPATRLRLHAFLPPSSSPFLAIAHQSKLQRLAARRLVHLQIRDADSWNTLLNEAQNRTNPDAMFRVGSAYLLEEGGPVPKDEHAAKAWLREAAELGHPRAQATIGRIVYDEMEALRDLGNVQDYQALAEAHKWLTRASDQGQVDATRTLVPLYVAKGDLAGACRAATLLIWRRLVGVHSITPCK